MTSRFSTLRLILGDQLNENHSWFAAPQPDVLYVLMEIRSETDYATHHIQKVVGFFSAMRLFAETLREKGHQIRYIHIDDADNVQDFSKNCQAILDKEGIKQFEYQEPEEYRLECQLADFLRHVRAVGGEGKMVPSEHFLASRMELKAMFLGKKTYRMEIFYRKMREKHGILMEEDGKTPQTGRWNYDAENRKKLPSKIVLPPKTAFYREVSDLVATIQGVGIATIGQVDSKRFDWALTRAESLVLLQDFIRFRFSHFGEYQDAMSQRDWLLFHSRLSFSMNIKLINPTEVVNACLDFYQKHPERVPFAALEGFIRQIVGWREYMRGIYWAEMPNYAKLNYFGHKAPLPSWFWTGQTKMNCLSHVINQSLEHAYAHHIQRLMVTGSFSLLLGAHPDEVDAWYLGIYMDALEWVEITNTRGMSQYADGGIVGSKPYVGSANYVDKMSDYCKNCHYDKSKRHGHLSCPFNSLYWDFYDRHREKLSRNPRIGMMYPMLDKMSGEELESIRKQAEYYKQAVESL